MFNNADVNFKNNFQYVVSSMNIIVTVHKWCFAIEIYITTKANVIIKRRIIKFPFATATYKKVY